MTGFCRLSTKLVGIVVKDEFTTGLVWALEWILILILTLIILKLYIDGGTRHPCDLPTYAKRTFEMYGTLAAQAARK